MDIFDIKLHTYPDWVRILMFSTALLWTVGYAALGFFAPPPKLELLEWAELRQVTRDIPENALVIVATLINNTDRTVAVSKMELQYFEDKPVLSGLQSNNRVDTTYVVARDEKGLFADSGDGLATEVHVTLNAPFAGQPFVVAEVPVSDVILEGEKSRILIMLRDKTLLDPRVKIIRAIVHSSDGTTIMRDIEIM